MGAGKPEFKGCCIKFIQIAKVYFSPLSGPLGEVTSELSKSSTGNVWIVFAHLTQEVVFREFLTISVTKLAYKVLHCIVFIRIFFFFPLFVGIVWGFTTNASYLFRRKVENSKFITCG